MNKYDSSKSKSYTPNGIRQELKYLDSKTAGYWSKDKVNFGNFDLQNHDFIESVSNGGNITSSTLKVYLLYIFFLYVL